MYADMVQLRLKPVLHDAFSLLTQMILPILLSSFFSKSNTLWVILKENVFSF